jgi:hypothetical protein
VNTELQLITNVLLIHWFADFLLQTRWQAENKSSNLIAISSHVGSYMAGMFVCLLVLAFSWKVVLMYTFVNGILHFAVDYHTSKLTSKLYKAGNIHGFFSVIGFDQFLHGACLINTINLLNQ